MYVNMCSVTSEWLDVTVTIIFFFQIDFDIFDSH